MTTITPTQARVNLSSVLRRALKGDDIGIVVGGQVVALRPVEILSRDYAEREYGLSAAQMKVVAKKLHAKAQKRAAPENPKSSRAISKPSLQIEFDPDLLKHLRSLDKEQRRDIGELIEKVRVSFGHTHLHGGTGLRALRTDVYECRLNLRQRLVFTLETGALYFHFIGSHEDVNRFLKNL